MISIHPSDSISPTTTTKTNWRSKHFHSTSIYIHCSQQKKNVSIFAIFCAHFPIVLWRACYIHIHPVLLMVILLFFYGFIAILNQIWYAIRILIAWYSSNYIFFRYFVFLVCISCRFVFVFDVVVLAMYIFLFVE